jgi:predicted regulator of Ras-like GTPase activity (Roadblock/LC7/MglB family)
LFAEILKKVVDHVDGGLGAVVMGLDGIPVETYTRQPDRVDINTVGMEFSFILTQARRAADSVKIGGFEELTVKADRLVLVLRMLSPQYFLGVAISNDGNFGKCRYLMRLAAPRLVAEL